MKPLLIALAVLLAPVASARVLYVAPNGTGTACTEAKPCSFKLVNGGGDRATGRSGRALLAGGDTQLLQRGGRYEGLLALPSGTPANPTTVSYWGRGARPVVEFCGVQVGGRPRRHLIIDGLHMYDPCADPDSARYAAASGLAVRMIHDWSHIEIRDSVIEGELVVQAHDGKRPSHITLTRNIFPRAFAPESSLHRNARPSNIYADGVVQLRLIENVFDYGGWHPGLRDAGANMFNHNVYGNHGNDPATLVVQGNIFARPAANGLQVRSGGSVVDNLFWQTSVGVNCGYDRVPMAADAVCHVERNVFLDARPMATKGVAPCRGTGLCSSVLWGIDLMGNTLGTHRVIDNILGPVRAEWRTGGTRAINRTVGKVFPPGKSGWLADVVERGNIDYGWSSASNTGNYRDPGRSLDGYAKTLGLADADAFLQKVKAREVGTWPLTLSAAAVNQYVREGFSSEVSAASSSLNDPDNPSITPGAATGTPRLRD